MSIGGFDENYYKMFMPQQGLRTNPYTPWQALADALKAVAAVQYKKREVLRQNFAMKTESARAGGMSALRQLYADPTYQEEARKLKITLPPLPAPGAGELKEGRFKEFYSKLDAVKRAKEAEVGRPLNPQELNEIRKQLGPEFFDIATDVGLPSQELAKSTMTTLVRSVLTGVTDPIRIVTAWQAAYKASGISPDEDDIKMFEQLWLSPTIDAGINKLKGDAANAWSTAALKNEKAKSLQAQFELDIQKKEQEIKLLLQRGAYLEAATLMQQIKAEWEPKIQAANIEYKQAQTEASIANVELIKAKTNLAKAHSQYVQQKRAAISVESTKENRKLQYNYWVKYVDSLRKLLGETQLAAEESSGDTRKKYLEMASEYSEELNSALSEMKRMKEWLDNEPGAIPPGDVDKTKFTFTSSYASQMFDAIMKAHGANPDAWLKAFNDMRNPLTQIDPKTGKLNEVSASWIRSRTKEDWDELLRALAAEYKKRTGKTLQVNP